MPDQYGFDHLPDRGSYSHRCIDCGWPGHGRSVTETDRRRHHDQHEREARKEREREQKANLAKARRAKREQHKENRVYDRQEGD